MARLQCVRAHPEEVRLHVGVQRYAIPGIEAPLPLDFAEGPCFEATQARLVQTGDLLAGLAGAEALAVIEDEGAAGGRFVEAELPFRVGLYLLARDLPIRLRLGLPGVWVNMEFGDRRWYGHDVVADSITWVDFLEVRYC